jgi:hypothetical protein
MIAKQLISGCPHWWTRSMGSILPCCLPVGLQASPPATPRQVAFSFRLRWSYAATSPTSLCELRRDKPPQQGGKAGVLQIRSLSACGGLLRARSKELRLDFGWAQSMPTLSRPRFAGRSVYFKLAKVLLPALRDHTSDLKYLSVRLDSGALRLLQRWGKVEQWTSPIQRNVTAAHLGLWIIAFWPIKPFVGCGVLLLET